MKLIEKKCPNCGASLSFNENDKSCKCEYCKRAFEVERKSDSDNSSINFDLSELKTPLKLFSFVTIGHTIISIVIILFVIITFAVIGFSISKNISDNNPVKEIIKDIDSKKNDENTLLTDINELSNNNLSSINTDASILISNRAKGVSDSRYSFSRDGNVERQKIYLAYKENENMIISIYKADYYNFFYQNERYTIFVPVVYRNVTHDIHTTLTDEKIEAPEYYFNNEHTTYFYGYSTLEETINAKIEPLRADYKITEK